MKKIVLLSLLLTLSLFAGDKANITFTGFSPDGEYVAFQQSGTQDGSGFPYAHLYIIDSAKNNYLVKPIKITIQDPEGRCNKKDCTEKDALKKTELKHRGVLSRTKISKKYRGTRLGMEIKKVNATLTSAHILIDSVPYILNLQEFSADKKSSLSGSALKKFSLSLKHPRGIKVLQRDRSLPKSRGEAFSYAIDSVYTMNHYLAVIISYQRTGYEGPDTRYMMVTGKLPELKASQNSVKKGNTTRKGRLKKQDLKKDSRRRGVKRVKTREIKMNK